MILRSMDFKSTMSTCFITRANQLGYKKHLGQREFTSAFLISWSARGKQFRLNSSLTRHLRSIGVERMDVLLNATRTCVAFVPSLDGRKVAAANADQSSLCAEPILRWIRHWGFKAGRWLVTYNPDGLLEIDLLNGKIEGRLNHIDATDRFSAQKSKKT